ncbi:MAG: hypothetical protein ACRDIF_01310 [Actinomycetota bacterium]
MERSETGLTDYVADLFAYLVRSSPLERMGQLMFFGTALLLPPVFLAWVLPWPAQRLLQVVMVVMGVAFLGSFVWYLSWMIARLGKFRRERPASYARWFEGGRGRPFGGFHLIGQLRLAKMQARYLFLSREPSPSETWALTMDFVRRSIY